MFAGIGMILRDHERPIIFSFYKYIQSFRDVWKMLFGNKSQYAFIIREIITCTEERDSLIAHTRRNCNMLVSHALANFGRVQRQAMVCLGSGLEEDLKLVGRDCNT